MLEGARLGGLTMENPFRQSDSIPVNKTEIELARIRETEETKRQNVAAREKTRQNRPDGYYVVRGIALGASVLITLIVSIASYSAHEDKMHAEHPASFATSGCVETSEVISSANSARSCSNGGWFLATSMANGTVLVQCKCSPRPNATAAPSASAP